MKKLLTALMLLITTFLYSQGSLIYTIEEINHELKEFGIPVAVKDTANPNIWISEGYDELGEYGILWFWLDNDLGFVTKTLSTLNSIEDFKSQKNNIKKNKDWKQKVKSKSYNQWCMEFEYYMIYVNTYEECLQIEYVLEIKNDDYLEQQLIEQYLLEDEN